MEIKPTNWKILEYINKYQGEINTILLTLIFQLFNFLTRNIFLSSLILLNLNNLYYNKKGIGI